MTTPLITPELVASAYTYDEYIQLAEARFAQHLSTADDPHYNTPEILGYTKLNLHRMSRLHKFTPVRPELSQALSNVPKRWLWLVLTESWCGDAAQIIPVLDCIAKESANVTLKFLLRDKNPVLMSAFLTNGGQAIPKLICVQEIDGMYRELGSWGPRPAGLQSLMGEWRTENLPLSEAVERAQRWYNADRTESTQAELLAAVTSWSKITV